jgi:hypothetical protein
MRSHPHHCLLPTLVAVLLAFVDWLLPVCYTMDCSKAQLHNDPINFWRSSPSTANTTAKEFFGDSCYWGWAIQRTDAVEKVSVKSHDLT